MWSWHGGKRKLSPQNTQYDKNISGGTEIATELYVSGKNTDAISSRSLLILPLHLFSVPRCHLFLGRRWFRLSVLPLPRRRRRHASAALLFSPPFHGNFQSHQRDTEWKVSFEFQRPDRTCCFHQPGRGPLHERPPSELIIPDAASCWPQKWRERQRERTGSAMFLMVRTAWVKAGVPRGKVGGIHWGLCVFTRPPGKEPLGNICICARTAHMGKRGQQAVTVVTTIRWHRAWAQSCRVSLGFGLGRKKKKKKMSTTDQHAHLSSTFPVNWHHQV